MPGELDPSVTSKLGGDDKTATDKARDKDNYQPEQKVKPRTRQTRKWFGFTQKKWTEIAGFAVLVPWIYDDLIDSHNLGRLLTLALSLAIAQGVVFSFLKRRLMALACWFISLIPLAIVVWANSQPLKDAKSYELIPPNVATKIVKSLLDPAGRISPAAFLVYPVNPDESAYALSEQLKEIFWDGKYPLIAGPPPPGIPEVPGVSCFAYGNAASNAGVLRALKTILIATKASPYIGIFTTTYPGLLIQESHIPVAWHSNKPPSLTAMIDQESNLLEQPFPKGIVVIMIRPK